MQMKPSEQKRYDSSKNWSTKREWFINFLGLRAWVWISPSNFKQFERMEHNIQVDHWLWKLNKNQQTTGFRGTKTSFNVQNLSPGEVYTFRIKSTASEWHIFKSATCEGILYTTRHLFCAMRSQKFGIIRKIVKFRW